MFTPRFADPNTESGKSFFNRKGIPEEKLKIKKLKRAAKDARKGAARQVSKIAISFRVHRNCVSFFIRVS